MVEHILAKTLLNTVPQPDTWFGLRYNMNLYRGCQHQCIYCDSRSACYQIADFSSIQVKVNAHELLEEELARKRVRGIIGTGSMNDPYMPVEKKYEQTGRALDLIARFRFSVHVMTKSDLVLRDIELLQRINQVFAAVSFSLSTADDHLAARLEPGASPPSERFAAMAELARAGILTGVSLMPILPFLEDSEENLGDILDQAASAGASYIIPSLGVTLRDRQREYYFRKLDELFPGISRRYRRFYGDQMYCGARNESLLQEFISERCDRLGLLQRFPTPQAKTIRQPLLF